MSGRLERSQTQAELERVAELCAITAAYTSLATYAEEAGDDALELRARVTITLEAHGSIGMGTAARVATRADVGASSPDNEGDDR